MERPTRVLILVQNATLPLDQRVWPEAQALTGRGYEVHVICPRDNGYSLRRENIGGVRIYRYSPGREGRGVAGYLREYAIAIASQLFLALVIRVRRRIDLVHICNPPDLLFLVALPLTALGAGLVYDHHDACPELMMAKGFRAGGWQMRLSMLFERLTYRACDVSLETNASFRDIALDRGCMPHEDVFVVRNAPERTRFAAARADDKYRYGRKHMVAYIGIMAIQDGLDYLIDAAHIIIADWQRDDIQFVLMGSGPEFERLRERVRSMNLDDYIVFTGFIADQMIVGSVLATADVCVSPDPVNPVNNISTMRKTVEYMAFRKPIVQFDLHEGRVSAGDASMYAAPNDATDFAKSIVRLIDDPEMRDRLGEIGFRRITADLSWDAQVPSLFAAYERVLMKKKRMAGTAARKATLIQGAHGTNGNANGPPGMHPPPERVLRADGAARGGGTGQCGI
jgi:glycosyltransferase involved in cell wall biosynthesis